MLIDRSCPFLCFAALALAAINPIQAALEPTAASLNTLGLPDWLIHWGHPGKFCGASLFISISHPVSQQAHLFLL